jgi:hypothetical protein
MPREPYSYPLQCPTCGARGTVEVSETPDGDLAEVRLNFSEVPVPFALVSTHPIRFRCLTCDELSV